MFCLADDEYKFRIASANSIEDWMFYLSKAAHTEVNKEDTIQNLMSFE
jgi:hypothetical protein